MPLILVQIVKLPLGNLHQFALGTAVQFSGFDAIVFCCCGKFLKKFVWMRYFNYLKKGGNF